MPPKKVDSNLKKGDKVQAKWSGSNTYYDAKILDVSARTCKVQYDDGTISSVKLSDIKSPKPEKKDPSPKRTRSRSRSAGRPRSRSRSPGRTEKKEKATKNEKKTTPKSKSEEKNKKEEKDSPKRINSVSKDETDSVTVKSSLTREKIGFGSLKDEAKSSTSTVTTTNSYMSKNLFISLEKQQPSSDLRLRSERTSSLRSADTPPEVKKTYEKSNAIRKDDGKYSDDEESEEEEEIKIIPAGPSKIWKTGNFLLTVFKIVLMPASLLFLVFACTKRQCTVLEAPQFYSTLKDLGNALKTTLPYIILFHLLVSVFSLIPFGKKVMGFPYGQKKSVREYCINGFWALGSAVLAFILCVYFGVSMNWGYDRVRPLFLSTAVYCLFYAVVLHVVSLINGDVEKESKVPLIGNFFDGVYYNPLIFGKIDIKTTFIRAGLIASVMFNSSILLKYYLMKGHFSYHLLSRTIMAVAFVLDYFVREEKMLSTATYTSDSVGYGFIMTTGFLIPLGLVLPSVYLFIYEAKLTTPYWYAAGIVLFAIGYYIYMSSGNLKHKFRSNPFSPELSDVASIPTSQKKRLISSKLWGIVRHPNYLGLILMAIGWTLPCEISHFIPYGPLVLLVIALILRCIRIEGECKEKYGPAWKNYTERVKSRLIPYIF